LVYFLTEKGLERFPTRYFRLTNMLLDQIKVSLPQATITNIFTEMANDMADRAFIRFVMMTTEQNLTLSRICWARKDSGWWRRTHHYQINGMACPFIKV
jgi:predicted ArsR family transcriptional regulator